MKLLATKLTLGLILWALPQAGRADFHQVSYDPGTDELVIVLAYSGTNPNHQFNVQWGPCIQHEDGSREIAAELLDQQAEDAAQQDFTTTLRVSLANLDCRPAAGTLRTAPRFYYTVWVPARGTNVAPR